MPFLELHLSLDGLDPEAVERACFATGALSVTLADAGEAPIFEPAPGATPLWPNVRLAALYAAATDATALEAALGAALGRERLPLSFGMLADRIWEREWLKDFHPMQFGTRLWICPGGQSPPATESAGATVVVALDPGLAFGSGTHPTTALCLGWLDGVELAGKRVLDVGCGSGVLAIAALALGAESALAVDIDPQALLATRENAARNRVEARLRVQPATADWGGDYDVLLANILAEPLIELAPRFARALRPGGQLLLSGVLPSQAAGVAGACAAWFDMSPPLEREGWSGLSGRRRS